MEFGLGTIFLIGFVVWIVFRMVNSNNESKRLESEENEEKEEDEKDNKRDRISWEIRKMVVIDWFREGRLTEGECKTST